MKNRIADLRRENKMTQQALAERLYRELHGDSK